MHDWLNASHEIRTDWGIRYYISQENYRVFCPSTFQLLHKKLTEERLADSLMDYQWTLLCRAITFATCTFSLSGNTPLANDSLTITERGIAISELKIFNNFVGML